MSIQPELKRLHSPDVPNLINYIPEDVANFGFLLQVMAGPVGGQGEESFDVIVCTARWLAEHLGPEAILVGRHHLVVNSYDYHKLEGFIRRYVAQCTGSTWQEIALRLGRLGKWEFEDYTP